MSNPEFTPAVTIVGGGLAGCEAAWQLARAGYAVEIFEMKPLKRSPAHKSDTLAELVCSNSFRSNNPRNAVGLLKAEMRTFGSLVMHAAGLTAVPAGDALAVDRDLFSEEMSRRIEAHPLIRVRHEEVTSLATERPTIIATGPLTSDGLAKAIVERTGSDRLYFYDAIAPIIDADSIDYDIVWAQSRYDKGEGADYLNCPLSEEQYYAFIDELLAADAVPDAPFEKAKYFTGCMPIEVIAASGPKSLAFGPMKPVGLTDPRTGTRPYGVVQLRRENKDGTAYNLVGFQTKLKYGEQVRVLRQIPGLANAEFLRLGSVHRNTYIHGPQLLDETLRLQGESDLYFAGQITGVEGYVESTACGMLAALFIASRLRGVAYDVTPPVESAFGALLGHVTKSEASDYQPSNINYSLFPGLNRRVPKREKKDAYLARATGAASPWWDVVEAVLGPSPLAPPEAAEVAEVAEVAVAS